MKNTLTEKLTENVKVTGPAVGFEDRTPEMIEAEKKASEKKLFRFPNSTIVNVGFNAKRNNRPYIKFTDEDGADRYADIHPALTYRKPNESHSPIFALVGTEYNIEIVGPYPETDDKGRTVNYFRAIAPTPTDAQRIAYEHYLLRKQHSERVANADEIARANF